MMVILTSDNEKENYQGQRGIIHNESRVKLSRRQNIPKCVCTKQSYKNVKDKLTELKGEIDKSTTVGDLNTPLLTTDRTCKNSTPPPPTTESNWHL